MNGAARLIPVGEGVVFSRYTPRSEGKNVINCYDTNQQRDVIKYLAQQGCQPVNLESPLLVKCATEELYCVTILGHK
jgi:hypothetical protein